MIKQVIYAPNMHQGGGRALLLPVLEALQGRQDVLFVLDERLVVPSSWHLVHIKRVAATVWGRLKAEFQLSHWFGKEAHVLCMASLPTLWVSTHKMTLFVHNRYLVEQRAWHGLAWKARVRLSVERGWLRLRLQCIHQLVVQTPSMQQTIQHYLHRQADVFPFADLHAPTDVVVEKKYDFLYVASGEAHKNHRTLIQAWVLLAQNNMFPSLCLTLHCQHFSELIAWIMQMKQQYSLKIICLDECSPAAVMQLYRQSHAFVYPSKFESFGLPLLEAVSFSLPVLASNLAYVHDVIRPSATFDADSAHSIAQAVQTFDPQAATYAIAVADAKTFLAYVFELG